MAALAHAADRPYLMHSCGSLAVVREDLIRDVKIDGKHSFEDAIESVIDSNRIYGHHAALPGRIDVDFLCRATEDEVRARVRRTLDACMFGGGHCLGTGNMLTNYIPLANYIGMLDEGRKFFS
jgi:uroporphyrinogen decarboxylase